MGGTRRLWGGCGVAVGGLWGGCGGAMGRHRGTLASLSRSASNTADDDAAVDEGHVRRVAHAGCPCAGAALACPSARPHPISLRGLFRYRLLLHAHPDVAVPALATRLKPGSATQCTALRWTALNCTALQALFVRPMLLVLDEPTNHLDLGAHTQLP